MVSPTSFVVCLFVFQFKMTRGYSFFFKADSYSLNLDRCPGRGSCRDMQKGYWGALAENEHLIRD